ncbi:MAG: mannonate dehydratase, partial [Lachnospirales bacterium]
MEMTLRWFGKNHDSVTLNQIRQIPGVVGVITTLYDIPVGEIWSDDRIKTMIKEVSEEGLKVCGIESVNIHDSIKIGNSDRDKYISNYITTLENLGKNGITMVCYNFMPVFDWTRSELNHKREDGSTVLYYNQADVDKINPEEMFNSIDNNSNGFVMPGWEPERLSKVKELFEAYRGVTEEKLFDNLIYFLRAIKPVCEKYNIKMAIHPDDPAWPVFGLPRIVTGKEKVKKLLKTIDCDFNG